MFSRVLTVCSLVGDERGALTLLCFSLPNHIVISEQGPSHAEAEHESGLGLCSTYFS